MRLRLAVLSIFAVGLLGAFAVAPASADVKFDNPGNANNVKICKLVVDSGSVVYPYTLTLTTPSGTVGPVTVNNLGDCVSTFAQNKDWTRAVFTAIV